MALRDKQGYAVATTELFVYLRGGLNNALGPAEIEDSQLTAAVGLEYRPPRLGCFSISGRTHQTPSGTGNGSLEGWVYDWDASTTGRGFDFSNMAGNYCHALKWITFQATGGQESEYGYLVFFSGSGVWGMDLATGYGASAVGGSHTMGEAHPMSSTFTTFPASGLQFGTMSATGFVGVTQFGNHWYFWNGQTRNKQSQFVAPSDDTGAKKVYSLGIDTDHGIPECSASAIASGFYVGATPGIQAGTYQLWHVAGTAPTPSQTLWEGLPAQGAYTGTPQTVTLTASGDIRYSVQDLPHLMCVTNRRFFVYMTPNGAKFPYGYIVSPNPNGYNYESATSIILTAFDFQATGTTIIPYRITAPVGGVPISTDGEPPIAYSMRAYQGSLVMIDAEERNVIRYTAADEPHSCPSSYYINFNMETGDRLTGLEVINDYLLVFSKFYGFKITDLPYAEDPAALLSSQSKLRQPFCRNYGLTGPLAICAFSLFGGGDLAFFVSPNGFCLTDGDGTEVCSNALDFNAAVDKTELWRANVINNPKYFRIEAYVIDQSGNPVRYDFYYHPKLLMANPGGLFPTMPITGPHRVPGLAACVSLHNDDYQVWTGSLTSNDIYMENTGTVDEAYLVDSAGTITRDWKTKNFYPSGPNDTVVVNNIQFHQAEATANHSVPVKVNYLNDDSTSLIFTATGTWNMAKKRYQDLGGIYARAQGFNMEINATDSSGWAELDYAVIQIERHSKRRTAQ